MVISKELIHSVDNGYEPDPLDESTIADSDTHVSDLEVQPPRIRSSNYLNVFKVDNDIEGQYVLDLSLLPPSLPGVLPGTNPKNLCLRTSHGSIHAEIWVIHDGSGEPKSVSFDLSTDGGFIRAILHDPSSPGGNSRARPALDMEMRANYGDVSVSLPHGFRGHITIRTGDERVSLSPALKECTALLSDVPGVRVYFVGDRPRGGGTRSRFNNENDGGETSQDEPLDELSIGGRYSSVRLNWDGEQEAPRAGLDPLMSFFSGADKFFKSGRIL